MLRAAGIDVWFDRGELRGGDAWDQRIRQQIRDCALFVPVISRNTQARTEGYFRLEWRLADQRTHLMSRSRPFLVPVCIDDTREKNAEVPDSFSTVHWLRVADQESTRLVLERVKQLLSATPPGAVGGSSFGEALNRRAARNGAARRAPTIGAAVALAAVAAIGTAYYFMRGAEHADVQVAKTQHPALARSLVVLPFVDMSEKHDQDYFADGLTEELIDRLARSDDIRVIARTSSFYFKGKPTTISSIVDLLHVTHVVEGSVRKSGNALRITAQLIRTSDGTHEWSRTYDRALSDIFKVQTDIASEISKALSAKLNGTEGVAGTENVEAYSLVLQGDFYRTRDGLGDSNRAIDAFTHAVQMDPHYAGAWTRLGFAYLYAGNSGEMPVAIAEKKATAAARQALGVDPQFSRAHLLLGSIERSLHWNWDAAEAEYERALATADNPTDRVDTMSDIEFLHVIRTGRYRSSYWETQEQALLRNPLNTLTMRSLAFDYLYDGQFAKGEALFERSLKVNPSSMAGHAQRAFALLLMSRFDESFAAAQGEVSENAKQGILAMTTWSLGRRAESDAYVRALEAADTGAGGDSYQLAQIHAWRGERDLAFKWLDRAFRAHDAAVIGLRMDPLLKNIRDDPRFAALLTKMKLSG